MFLLYHSDGCNICELVLHECYINDLHTTTCSGMLGHHTPLSYRGVMQLVDSWHKEKKPPSLPSPPHG
jgi:hypothetical protein